MKRQESPLTAFANALVQLALVARWPALLLLGMVSLTAGGGDDAAQESANNTVAELPPLYGGCCVSGFHG